MGMKIYEVWSEGFRATGESGGACFHGRIEAGCFKDACDLIMKKDSDLYDPDRLTFWGCRLFDNEAKARKLFG